jgi:hypothetical protein
MFSKEQLEEISRRTGLKTSTLEDLFKQGWTFVEAWGEVRRWVGPEAQLHI